MSDIFVWLGIGSLICLVTAIPLALGQVKPNRFYGVRIQSTFNNNELWYRANRVYGRAMILSSLAFFAICLLAGSWRADANDDVFNLLLFIAQVFIPTSIALFSIYSSGKNKSS